MKPVVKIAAALVVVLGAGAGIASMFSGGGKGGDGHGDKHGDAHGHGGSDHGPVRAKPVEVETIEFSLPSQLKVRAGFGPLRLLMAPLIPAPQAVEAESRLRYSLHRSVDRVAKQALLPDTWEPLDKGEFRLDRHLGQPEMAAGAVYAVDGDVVVEPKDPVFLTLRIKPPADAGEIPYAAAVAVADTVILDAEGTAPASGKPVDIPFAFEGHGLADLPMIAAVAVGGPSSVEVQILDAKPGRDLAPLVPARTTSAADQIVRPVMPGAHGGAAAEGGGEGGGHGGGDKKKDKKEKKEKKEKKGEGGGGGHGGGH
jgi:hypothetical protein